MKFVKKKLKNYPREEILASDWQQGGLVEVEIADLSDRGDGVGRYGEIVVFVPDTVRGDRALVRLVRVKPKYAFGKLDKLLTASPHRIRPRCIVADKCGGCQWQHVSDEFQQQAKRNQVVQALARIGGFSEPFVAPILTGEASLGYRNKATYPLAKSSSGKVQAGYYRRNTHLLVNLNQCPVQDPRLNPLLAEVKKDIQERGWSIYDEKSHQGQLRHLSLRIGRHTGEILLTLVSTEKNLPGIARQAEDWMQRYPELVGVCLNLQRSRTNVIFGQDTICIAGQPSLAEKFANLNLQLRPETFFQINTEAAEALLAKIIEMLNLQGKELLVDAYCGIGTFTLPLAKRVKEAIAIEVQAAAVEQAQRNAENNGINNVKFKVGKVEDLLSQISAIPDIILLDPPRQGCDRAVLETLLQIKPKRIVYISCKPATLARDLQLLCQKGDYQLTYVQPADFFPQTSHIEAAAFLELSD
ncbi:23S rRNA (uracil(1939)-C(5))-methyltransferase RlmD [Oscillatoria salina]|uniref:23S rRNA (uracil(1939)-C(5))-methyltransferase RlmD n=1 Tax=Oscillatoria salina TaxID=331517 RepID=UPI001CCC6C3B|nr:23S rRNA (uracil(1939)-C(5))-methyltransferase RlmD [Oscillatoria salina]MBZ8180317.1 23S rRNA (uracil(1939)-C(5))-methyltransferase RlmD [Oscillatoria salina IIICB1]